MLSNISRIMANVTHNPNTITQHTKNNANGAHSGAVTHHQDQSITCVSCKTKNTKNSNGIGVNVKKVRDLSDISVIFIH